MTSPIRVAMVIKSYLPHVGGAERQIAALAPLLRGHGVEIYVVTRRFPGMTWFEIIDDVPVYRLPILGSKAVTSLVFTLGALPLLGRLRPHIIHAHGLQSPTTIAIAAKRLFGIPAVSKAMRGGALGGLDLIKQKPFGNRRIATVLQRVDAFAVISHEIDTELTEIGIPAERRLFIPNGVNIERFVPRPPNCKQHLRTSLNLPDGPIAVFTGRLDAEKRVGQLIAIWPAVRIIHPKAQLLILGTGAEEEKLKQSAGVGVQFLGRVDDVVPYLQAADLFVLPSATEGLSNSLLEAMAVGLPTIATTVGGTPDLIEHGVTGWLVPPDSPPLLQDAVLTLMDNRNCRNKLAHRGRQHVVEQYALPIAAKRLHALYSQLITS